MNAKKSTDRSLGQLMMIYPSQHFLIRQLPGYMSIQMVRTIRSVHIRLQDGIEHI